MVKEIGRMVDERNQTALTTGAHQGCGLAGEEPYVVAYDPLTVVTNKNHKKNPNTTHLVCCRSVEFEIRR
jgi:hypothetical protein